MRMNEYVVNTASQSHPDLISSHCSGAFWTVRSTSMKSKSLIATVPPEARDLIAAGTAKPPSPVLGPQTFQLPQRLIDDLARAGELRALFWLDREGNTWLPTKEL
jgi:hypothetical protein